MNLNLQSQTIKAVTSNPGGGVGMCDIKVILMKGLSGLPEILSHTASRLTHTEQIRLVGLY